MGRILTASLGAGRVSGHRTIGVIPGGDQRPGQQGVSVPGGAVRGAAAGNGAWSFTVAGAGIGWFVRRHLTACGVMLAGQARLAPGWMRACRDAISDGEGLVQQWRVTRLTRLGNPRAAGAGPGRSRRLASDRPAGPAWLCPGRWPCAWSADRSAAAVPAAVSSRARPAPGPGGTRQAGGRHHGPFGPLKNPGCPGRAVAGRAGTGDRPGRRRCAAAVLRWPRRGPAGPVRQVLPSRAPVRVPVGRRAHALVIRPRLAVGRLAPAGRLLGDPRWRGADLFLSLHNILPDWYPLTGFSIEQILALENYAGRLIDYGVILPKMQALYEFAASDLDEPRLLDLVKNGFPVYAWPYEDRHAWTTTKAPSARSVLSWLTSA